MPQADAANGTKCVFSGVHMSGEACVKVAKVAEAMSVWLTSAQPLLFTPLWCDVRATLSSMH